MIPGFSVAGQIVFGLACLLFGSWFVHFCVRARRQAKASPAWKRVPGRVVAAIVVPDDNGYAPLVTYTYEVDGKPYRSSRLAFTFTSYFRERHAQAVADRYRRGKEIAVWVDPDDPAQAVLEPGTGVVVFTLFGVVALALAGFGLYALAGAIAVATAR